MTIKVNKKDWAALTADQQTQIAGIIGTNFDGQTIEAVDGGVASVEGNGICETACDIAQATAINECKKLPFGQSICISIAKEAGNYCREQC